MPRGASVELKRTHVAQRVEGALARLATGRYDKEVIVRPTGWKNRVHAMVISNFFRGKSQGDRQRLIWDHLERELRKDEIMAISLCMTWTKEEMAN